MNCLGCGDDLKKLHVFISLKTEDRVFTWRGENYVVCPGSMPDRHRDGWTSIEREMEKRKERTKGWKNRGKEKEREREREREREIRKERARGGEKGGELE